MWAEYRKAERAHRRGLYWHFIRLLLAGPYNDPTPKSRGIPHALYDEYATTLGINLNRWICLLAMLIHRGWSARDKSYDYSLVAFCNHHSDGYGWGSDTLEFNRKSFRYHISSDGESFV
jgi:hypothetical protein